MQKDKPGGYSLEDRRAPSLTARVVIADAICVEVRRWKLTQEKAANRLGMHRTQLSRLLNGDLTRFGLGNLVDLADAAGVDVSLTVGQQPPHCEPQAPDEVGGTPASVYCSIFQFGPADEAKRIYAERRMMESDLLG